MRRRLLMTAAIGLTVLALLSTHAVSGNDKSLTFYLPFEKDAVATVAGGNPQPSEESQPGKLVEGIKGQGMLLDQTTLLRYLVAGNCDNARGALSFWVKFLSADFQEYHHLFYEEGGEAEFSSRLKIMTIPGKYPGGGALYCDFRTRPPHWTAVSFPLQKLMGEWHQIVITWDKDIGDRIYIDGRFRRWPLHIDFVTVDGVRDNQDLLPLDGGGRKVGVAICTHFHPPLPFPSRPWP